MASGNRTDISLDDPNFWDKWAKKADIDMEMVNGRVRAAARTAPSVRAHWISPHQRPPPTEQLGDRHAARQEADAAVQRHQGRAGRAFRRRERQRRDQTQTTAKLRPPQQLRTHRVLQGGEEPAGLRVRLVPPARPQQSELVAALESIQQIGYSVSVGLVFS